MGDKNKLTVEEEQFLECEVCQEEIVIDYYMDSGDLVACEECGSGYILKSRDPIKLDLQEEDDAYENNYFDEDDCFNQGYD